MTAIINLFTIAQLEEPMFSLEGLFTPILPQKEFVAPFLLEEATNPALFQEEFICPLLLEEVISKEESIFSVEDEGKEEELNIFQILQEMYEAPPEAGGTGLHSGSSHPVITKHNPFPMHFAAGQGNLAEMKKLLRAGVNVNAEDARSATALVVATIFGKKEAVNLLLKAGAMVNDKCYEGQTALHIALDRKQYDIARTLVQEGADPKLKTWKDLSATTIAFSQLEKAITAHNLQKDSRELQNEVNEIVSTLETFAQKSKQIYLHLQNAAQDAYQIPLSVALKTAASNTASTEIKERILKISDTIAETDPLQEGYVQAKNLLSSFPTGKTYTIGKIKLDGGEPFKIMADGHYKHYTTPLAKNSLDAFVSKLDASQADETKLQLFTKVRDIFDNASKFANNSADPTVAEEAFELYQSGATVLLPSICDKHFINVIVSKTQSLLAIANTGDRYALDTPGIMLHDIYNDNTINSAFMNKVLTNKDRMFMDFYMQYEFGPILKLNTLNMPNQQFGNCTWESHRNAVKGILYIELLNEGFSAAVAEKQAHTYFKEWDNFHSQYMLEDYLSHSQILPASALGDVYLSIQKKKSKGEFTETDASNAKLLMKALTSTVHQAEFKAWKKSLPQTDVKIVNADTDSHIDASTVYSGNHTPYFNPLKFLSNLFVAGPSGGSLHKFAADSPLLHTAHQEPLVVEHQEPAQF